MTGNPPDIGSGHSDIVATFPDTKYIYSIIFRSDIVARKGWPKVATISKMHCTCTGIVEWLHRHSVECL